MKLIKWLVGLLFIALLLFAAYIEICMHFAYSDGERAGYLQKFSRKGWLCKTYEGEIALTTVPGVAPLIWDFTVRDEAVASQMNAYLGKQIAVSYQEHRGIPSNCYGDTNYYVESVRPIEK